ncbi:MAG: LapA family protein [Gammaproteobacteria bacterium]|jgi:putative membrane protein
MARLFRFVFYLIIAFLAVFFALLNSQPSQFDYYFGKADVPLAMLLAIAMAIGALLGVIASMGMVLKSKRQSSSLRKSASNAEKELAKVRAALPHQDQS